MSRKNFDAIADSDEGTIESGVGKKPRYGSSKRNFFGPPTGTRDLLAESQEAFKKRV